MQEENEKTGQPEDRSRRRFLLSGAAGLAALGALPLAVAPRRVFAQSTMTASEALAELLAGNKRFTSGTMTAHTHDLEILKQKNAEHQQPFAAVLSCADSRVPVELIFDQSIGELFVNRVAGNIVTSEIIASLEYGAGVLGTRVILVLGHGSCGAVKATMQAKEVPGQISALYPHIRPAVDQGGQDLETVIKVNAKLQADLLREASTVIAGLVKEEKVKVAAAYYDIVSGVVTLL